MIASVALFSQLWASCVGPIVAVETGASVARAESGFDSLAVHDNTTGRSYTPTTRADAVAIATTLRHAGNSLDLGLMQVNSANLARIGLSIPAVFDACRNMAAGARILLDSYLAADGKGGPQTMLRQALSRYNTGNSAAGFANGYVAHVETAAAQVVPAIRVRRSVSSGLPGKLPHFQSDANPTPAANGLIDGLVHQGSGSDGAGVPATWSGDPLIHPRQADPLAEHAIAPASSHPASTADGSARLAHPSPLQPRSPSMTFPTQALLRRTARSDPTRGEGFAFAVIVAALSLIAPSALAQVSGGVDPQSALQSLLTYGMGAAGAAISIICLFKGGHAVAEGRHLLPYIGGAIGGIILAFGGGFLLQHIGVG